MLDIRVADRVQALLLDACRFEDAVVAATEVDGTRVAAVLVGDQRRVLAEVPLRAQVEDGVDRRLVERHVALARRALELADLDFPAAGGLRAVAPGYLLHAALEMQNPPFKVDVGVEQSEHLIRPHPCVEHQRVRRCLLVDALAVAPCTIRFCLKPLDLLRRERRDRLERGLVLFSLCREEVCLLDHRRRRHRILANQLLLCEVAEVIGQQIIDLFDGRVRVALVHPVVEQHANVRRADVADDLAAEDGINLVLRCTLQPVVAAALDGWELEDFQPVRHAIFERFLRFVALDNHFVEGGDVIDHLFVDLRLARSGEALALPLAVLVHVPHNASPATVGALERIAVGEQLSLCHADPPFCVTLRNNITEGSK